MRYRVRQACEEGFQVVTMVECVGEFDFFASATCSSMKRMKNNAIVGDIGRIDKEIDVAGTASAVG